MPSPVSPRYPPADQPQGLSQRAEGDRGAYPGDGAERGAGGPETEAQGAGRAGRDDGLFVGAKLPSMGVS